MRAPEKFVRLFFPLPLLILSCAAAAAQAGGAPLLPEQAGDYRAQGRPAPAAVKEFAPEDFGVTAAETRAYTGAGGEQFTATFVKTRSASAAYSLLCRSAGGAAGCRLGALPGSGVLGVEEAGRARFVKGSGFADVRAEGEQAKTVEALRPFVKSLAGSLPGAAGQIPVLVLHLPEWEKKVAEGVGYAVSLPALQQAAGNRPALDAVEFDGGTEAVAARYGDARLVIIEFPTPQHSVDADAAINRRIGELRAQGQPVPSAYSRVGNYSVFVFDAPDSSAAEKLISGVKYEKDVRWLGHNPHAEEIATRAYTSTMGGVLLTTIITAGLSILLCLGVGGAVGAVIFFHRRSRNAAQEIYTDAGGMVRLNIEDLNTPPDPTRLLGRGEE